jgi:hypothetical protein
MQSLVIANSLNTTDLINSQLILFQQATANLIFNLYHLMWSASLCSKAGMPSLSFCYLLMIPFKKLTLSGQ